MGALFQNVCYPDQASARQQACAQFDARVMATTNLYTTECTSTTYTAATMSLCKRTNGGACTTVPQPWPVTPPCDYSGGVTLGYDWFLASMAFVIVCWAARKLINLFTNDTVQS